MFCSLSQVIAAAIRGARRGRKRQSAYIYMDALLYLYNEHRLLPRGMLISAPAVQDWACRTGAAIRRGWRLDLQLVWAFVRHS